MRTYRIYRLDHGHITAPPAVVECETEEAAIREARQYVDGLDVELWEGSRLVWTSPPKH
jgi:hypothetical protein